MRKTILYLIFFLVSSYICAQEYSAPKNYKFDNKEDYTAYEPQVKETINWILQTSLGKEATVRQQANAFLMAWLIGSPTVSVNMNVDFITFTKTNPELLMIFIAGWTKYSLDNNYSKDQILGNKAGIETVVEFYNKNRGYLKKDKDVEKFAKLAEKGTLEAEIKKKLKL